MNNSLTDLTVKGLLDVTAGKDPVPGGGSISALSGSFYSGLGKTGKEECSTKTFAN